MDRANYSDAGTWVSSSASRVLPDEAPRALIITHFVLDRRLGHSALKGTQTADLRRDQGPGPNRASQRGVNLSRAVARK